MTPERVIPTAALNVAALVLFLLLVAVGHSGHTVAFGGGGNGFDH